MVTLVIVKLITIISLLQKTIQTTFGCKIDFFAEIFKHVTVDLLIEFRIVKGSSVVARCLEIIHSEGFYPYLCVIDRNQQQIDVRLSFFNVCLTDFNEFLTTILTL